MITNKSLAEQFLIVENYLNDKIKDKNLSFIIDATTTGFYGKNFAGCKIDTYKNISRFRFCKTLVIMFPITYDYFDKYFVKLSLSKREIHIPECEELIIVDESSSKVLYWIHKMPTFRNLMINDIVFPNFDLEVEEYSLIKWSKC